LTDAEHALGAFPASVIKVSLDAAKIKMAELNAQKPARDKEKARIEKATQDINLDFPDKAKVTSHSNLGTVRADNEAWFKAFAEHKKRLASLQEQHDSQRRTLENAVAAARREVQDAANHVSAFKVALDLVRARLTAAKDAYHAEHIKHKNADEKVASALTATKAAVAAVKQAYESRNQAYAAALTRAQDLETKHIAKMAKQKEAHAKLKATILSLKQKLTHLTQLVDKVQKKHGELLNQAKLQQQIVQQAQKDVTETMAGVTKSKSDFTTFTTSDAAKAPLEYMKTL